MSQDNETDHLLQDAEEYKTTIEDSAGQSIDEVVDEKIEQKFNESQQYQIDQLQQRLLILEQQHLLLLQQHHDVQQQLKREEKSEKLEKVNTYGEIILTFIKSLNRNNMILTFFVNTIVIMMIKSFSFFYRNKVVIIKLFRKYVCMAYRILIGKK